MLKKVKVSNPAYTNSFKGFTDGLINLGEISSIIPYRHDTLPGQDMVQIRMKNGEGLICMGKLSDFEEVAKQCLCPH